MANNTSRIRSQIDEKQRRIKWLDDEINARTRDLEAANRKAKEASDTIGECINEKHRLSQEITQLTGEMHEAEENEREEGKNR